MTLSDVSSFADGGADNEPAQEHELDPADSEFLGLLERLAPFLADTAKAAVAEAVATTPVPVIRPGTVRGVSADDRSVTVLVDGDTDAIAAQVIIPELPGMNDRVMVLFQPPSAVFIVGVDHSSVPPGTILHFAGPISAHAGAASTSPTPGQPPRGFLWCAGQAVSRSDYSALFVAIGTTYGVGDGSTTFNVPDLRGRALISLDNMGNTDAGRLSVSNTLGGTGGAQTHTLSTGNLPAHAHTLGSHTHGVGTYAVASHTHDLANHTHSGSSLSVASHTHTISSSGTHQHTSPGGQFFAEFGAGNDLGAGAATGTSIVGTSASVQGGGDHSHGGATGSASPSVSGSTGTPSTNTSGSASPSLSGASAAATGDTGSVGSGTAVDHLPPYMLVHGIIKY